jgi:predicted dienelactone hydrolase
VPALGRRRVGEVKRGSTTSRVALALLLSAAAVCAVLLSAPSAMAQPGPFAVGKIVITFTDKSRGVTLPGRRHGPRVLRTVIRYPAIGDPSQLDVRDAPPASVDGPFPVIVFAHGFEATPDTYSRLMRAWAQAGYVVAAPTFPLTNANAPGGAKESDLVNQPRDMSFVISRMLARNAGGYGVLSGLINPNEIAVAGHSDGGSTALAVAYNRHYVDHRIRAAVILAGAEIPGVFGYSFPAPSPPLLAVQGTADTSNVPASTRTYYRLAPSPKFLLSLLGAGHGPPYIAQPPQLSIVEQVTSAFLDAYVKGLSTAPSQMWSAGNVSGVAKLSS